MLKIEKFTDVCMTGGIMHTPSHTNVCKFSIFNIHFLVKQHFQVSDYHASMKRFSCILIGCVFYGMVSVMFLS